MLESLRSSPAPTSDPQPDILPIEEIGVAWGPLVSLGREVGTPVGPIENFFVSPSGELTIVEAKLWRNPEARREVVGQIINYAAALSRMSYDDLNDAVRRAAGDGISIWERVVMTGNDRNVDEGQFVDTHVDVVQLVEQSDESRDLARSVGSFEDLRRVFVEKSSPQHADAVIRLARSWSRNPDQKSTINMRSVKLSARFGPAPMTSRRRSRSQTTRAPLRILRRSPNGDS